VTVALLVITDGREDYLARTVDATREHLAGDVTERWMFDDTGDRGYRATLRRRYPEFEHIDGGHRQGFGGAIRSAWQQLRRRSSAPYLFHLEQDFTLLRHVDVDTMARVLAANPHLVHLALRRQPWNPDERAAGGVVERYPAAYQERGDAAGNTWLEHRLFFTTNPSLYRRSLIVGTDWPDVDHSEGVYTMRLLEHGTPEVGGDTARFGYWGARDSGVAVTHIGEHRSGVGY
jgi:hypothetical protein